MSGDTIQERFEAFHAKHPEVYAELVALARRAHRAGRRKIAIDQLFQVLRWDRMTAGLPDAAEDFKLNDHYRSRYARLIMTQCTDLEGIFGIRGLRAQ